MGQKTKPKAADADAEKRPLRLEHVQASTLALNPRNWRRHPESQLSTDSAGF